jgi:hypothetical protein
MTRFPTDEPDRARTAVRLSISVFVAVSLLLSVLGWVWTGAHQPPAQAVASRLVLATAALVSAAAVVAIWRRR